MPEDGKENLDKAADELRKLNEEQAKLGLRRLEEDLDRQKELGILDDDGNRLASELPPETDEPPDAV